MTFKATEVKNIASALALASNAVFSVMEDGKINLSDIPKIPQLLSALNNFTEIDYGKLLNEVSEVINPEDAQDIADHFAEVFNIPNDSIEAVIEQGLQLIVSGIEAIHTLKAIVSRLTKPAA
jgi:hypothetical protein